MHADGVDLSGFNDLKPTVTVIVVIAEAGQGRAYASVDVGVIGEETLFMSVVEVGAVIDRGLLCRGTTEDFGPPCVT